jgi:simple sugar transport system ATP-binding protein
MEPAYELELAGITKRYPGVLANDRIELRVRSGDIHAVVGENGAGKTTLMSILYGLISPDEGEIRIRGKPASFHSPLDAIDAGLGMVHQAFKLFPTLTVAENVVFGSEPGRFGMVSRSKAISIVDELAQRYELAADPRAKVEDLPVGVLQRVEILKALYRNARVLILDEPTAVLTPQERDALFVVMRGLKQAGVTIVFITHKLGEVMAVSDRVTVLRTGRVVADLRTPDTNPQQISRFMTGRDVDLERKGSGREFGPVVLAVESLMVAGLHGLWAAAGVSLEVRAGEIVGIAGVAGNGQNELVEAITGLRPVVDGTIRLGDAEVTNASVEERRRTGMAYIPEDRYRVGTALSGQVLDNLLMGYQRLPGFRRGMWMRPEAAAGHARRLVESHDIKVGHLEDPASSLSGGNLQKLVVARELEHEARLLIAEQPTRGVDIGATEFVHGRLRSFAERGGAVLLISAELSELLSLADRILVMFEGRIVSELDTTATDETEIGLHMTGGHLAGAASG